MLLTSDIFRLFSNLDCFCQQAVVHRRALKTWNLTHFFRCLKQNGCNVRGMFFRLGGSWHSQITWVHLKVQVLQDIGHRPMQGYHALADCGVALRCSGSSDLLASVYSKSQMVEDHMVLRWKGLQAAGWCMDACVVIYSWYYMAFLLFHKVCWVLVLGMDLWRIGSNSTRGLLVSSFWDSVVDSDTGKNWAWKVSRKITEMRSEEKVSSLGFFQFCDSCGLYVFHRVKKNTMVTMTDVERSPVCL